MNERSLLLKSQVLSAIPGIDHAFGTRIEPFPQAWKEEWDQKKPHWKQVHKTDCAEVLGPSQNCGEVDGVHTRQTGQIISVVTADCLPVLLARSDGQWVAAIHAGWRGLIAGIVERFWEARAREGEVAKNWKAAIGPAIGPCCYEVSEELASQFKNHYAELGAGLAVPRHRHLALAKIQAASLRKLGFAEVEIIRSCTRCTLTSSGEPVSHSYRREGGGTRQWSSIRRNPI